jgi:hypothetical protein
VLDSWSKIANKTKYGNTYDFGKFQQCLQIRHQSDDLGVIEGKHCLFQYYSKSNDTVPRFFDKCLMNRGWKDFNKRFGGAICVPAECSAVTVKRFLQFLLLKTDYKVADDYEQQNFCKTSKTSQATSKSYLTAVCLISFLLLCVASSTIYDLITSKAAGKKRVELLLTFSVIANVSKLFDVSSESKNEVRCFHCIRTVFSLFIVFAHLTIFSINFPSNHQFDFQGLLLKLLVAAPAVFSLNGFLIMSGFLATHSSIKKSKYVCKKIMIVSQNLKIINNFIAINFLWRLLLKTAFNVT